MRVFAAGLCAAGLAAGCGPATVGRPPAGATKPTAPAALVGTTGVVTVVNASATRMLIEDETGHGARVLDPAGELDVPVFPRSGPGLQPERVVIARSDGSAVYQGVLVPGSTLRIEPDGSVGQSGE